MFSYLMCVYIGVKLIINIQYYFFSYFMCNFIALEFNNTYSLICFRILCNSIYVEKAKKRIKFTFIYM